MDVPIAEVAIVEMTNAFRQDNGLSQVRSNKLLAAAARRYAKKLAATGEFSHTVGGTDLAGRVTKAGYTYCQIAENLALLYDSRGFEARDYARRTVEGWEESPGHRKNMLTPNVTEIGVAIVRAPARDPKYIAVQLFGRPMALKYEFKIKNTSRTTVPYDFGGKSHSIEPRYTITHTACEPGAIIFKTGGKSKRTSRYQARNGQVFTISPAKGGGAKIQVSQRSAAN